MLAHIFAEEGRGLYDVRQAVIGHLQQGGDPTPFDRIMATKLVAHALGLLAERLSEGSIRSSYVGIMEGRLSARPLERMEEDLDLEARRPLDQWWMGLRGAIPLVSQNSGVLSIEQVPDFRETVDAAASPLGTTDR